jgi:hypothetical protein
MTKLLHAFINYSNIPKSDHSKMLLKSTIVLAVLFVGFSLGLQCYKCSESKKNPRKNGGGPCYSPEKSATAKSTYKKCAYCGVKISEESDGKGGYYGNFIVIKQIFRLF